MRKAILSKADKNLVAAICQTIHNMLEWNLSINNNDFKNLKKYRKTFRKLIEKSKLKNKKEILIQKGGFLQFLIYLLATIENNHSKKNPKFAIGVKKELKLESDPKSERKFERKSARKSVSKLELKTEPKFETKTEKNTELNAESTNESKYKTKNERKKNEK